MALNPTVKAGVLGITLTGYKDHAGVAIKSSAAYTLSMAKGAGSTCGAMVSPVEQIILELPRGGEVEVIPGVLDQQAEYAFSAGHCHALALAIHERTGWPLLAMSGRHSLRANLQHVVVVMPDGRWFDVQGPQDPEERYYFQEMTAEEVANMGKIEYWKNPETHIAREFVQPVFERYGLLSMLKA